MGRSRRVLLVDDEPRNLLVLEGCLEPLGYTLLRANGGVEALERVERDDPDLVLLDLRMPDLDGIDVLTHVRARTDRPHLPIILVTAHADREHRLRGLEAGADDFLEKPIDRAILVARVQLLLRLKDASDALAQRNRDLERLADEQRELSAFIVHDLKNPIAVARINLEWARDQITDPDINAALVDASDAVIRLQSMVEDLLTISRLESADLPLRREAVPVRDLLDSVARAHTREIDEKSIAVAVSAENELSIEGDALILRRLFENMVENAVRHTPRRGRIALEARRRECIEVAVSNTGTAIAESDRARIFEKHMRGKNASGSSGHLGLGLYFCRRAVEVHGGAIELREDPEWPTSFVVRLPAT